MEKSLPNWRLTGFAMMAIPIAALGLPFVVYLPAFYKNELGITATAVGLVVMLARFWDVFTDPIFGSVSDHLPTRWGRRRHWIVLAVPLQMLCAWYLFMPNAGASVWYLGLWLFLIYITSTMIVISHISWGAELSHYYHERARIQGFREFGLIGGMILVLALPTLLGASNRVETVQLMGLFIIIAAPVCALITLLTTPKEHVPPQVASFDIKAALLFFMSSSNLRVLLIAAFLAAGIAPGITGALYIDVITHVFNLGPERNILLLAYFLSAVLSVPFWILLSKRVGKHRALAIASFYGGIILSMAFFMPHNNFWAMLVGLLAYGAAYGAAPFLLRALMADFADFDELQSGQKRTGLCFALLNMIEKIGIAVAVGLIFPLLDVISFSDEVANSPSTLDWLLVIYVVPSTIFLLIAGLVMWNYPINQARQEEMQLILARRAR